MQTHKIAVIAGDGIGPEVIAEGVKVLQTVAELDGSFQFDFTYFPWGCEYYKETGRMMAADGIEQLSEFDAIFLGAVGAPGVPDHISLWDLLLVIRKKFDQYVNLRPVKLLQGAPCPLKDVKPEDVDMIFVRENTEGEYAGSGSWLYKDQPNEVVIQDGVFSRKGCERIIRYAYELAASQGTTLTSISKGNALNYSMVFWDQIFREVGQDYPQVKTYSYLVDAASMFMVKDPKWWSPPTSSATFSPIWAQPSQAVWDWLPAQTSIRNGNSPLCLNRSTAPLPILPVRARQTLWLRYGLPASFWNFSDIRTGLTSLSALLKKYWWKRLLSPPIWAVRLPPRKWVTRLSAS